jgi:hypothetical protein
LNWQRHKQEDGDRHSVMSDANELVEAITCGGRRRHWADGEKLRIVVTRCAATIHLAHRVALIRAYSRAQRRLDIRPIPSARN